MEDNGKRFGFVWKIKDFNFICNSSVGVGLRSPFYSEKAYQSHCCLGFVSNIKSFEDDVGCSLNNYYSGPNGIKIDYEISFLTGDESVIHSEIFRNVTFKQGLNIFQPVRVKRDEIFLHKKHLFLPNDTLTLRCRLWKSKDSTSDRVKCSVDTRINTDCRSLVGTIDKFTSLQKSSKNAFSIKSSTENFLPSSMNLCISDDGKLHIEVNIDYELNTTYNFKVFILDVWKNKIKSCKEEIYEEKSFIIPLTFSKKGLIENKELFLPNDVLTLECQVISFTVKEPTENVVQIGGMVYDFDCRDNQEVIAKLSSMNPTSEEHHTESLPTLKDDFISLLKEGILSDTKLKTSTETFPVHTAVLGARSPVFKSMFETDMKEKTNSCVDIDDLNADTVRQMLLFMYSDILNDLDYEGAKSLYYAADKYNIVSLRQRCSHFLKENLLFSNCCDVLVLADKHQDTELKISVQDCIAKNDEAVFSSDEWKDLEENNPRLTTQILRAVYMKNRRT